MTERLSSLAGRDLLDAYRLLSEVRDLGADARAWRPHLLKRLTELLGGQVVIGGEMRGFDGDTEPTRIGIHRIGWADDASATRWNAYATSVPMERTPEYPSLAGLEGACVTRLRDELWPRDVWYRSDTFNEIHRQCGIDDYVISIARVERLRLQSSIWLHRPLGAPAFTARERDLLDFIHSEVAEQIGGALASLAEPSISMLTPRQRQVLDHLLDGDSEKQVAGTLGLSRATVHEHVAAIYRHFEISSRGELMAIFVGRARPPRFS